jgi:hypothetical protein
VTGRGGCDEEALHTIRQRRGLVPVASALGVHRDPKLALNVPQSRQMVVTAANHWDLLSRDDVYQQIRAWLA